MLQNISDHVYTKEDLFHETFLKELQNWNPHEIFSSNLGLCFSVKLNQKVTESTQNFKFLKLPVDKEYQVNWCFSVVQGFINKIKTQKIKMLCKSSQILI